jgi:hypothetical protein
VGWMPESDWGWRRDWTAWIWVATQALSSTVPRPEMSSSERLRWVVLAGLETLYGRKGGTVSMCDVRRTRGPGLRVPSSLVAEGLGRAKLYVS